MNLAGAAEEIQHRLIHIFARDENGRRAVNGGNPKLNRDPHFRDYIHFYEVSAERMADTRLLGRRAGANLAVLPRERRAGTRRVAPDGVDRAGRVEHHADGRVLPAAENA